MKKPTIYDELKKTLGREPNHDELNNEVKGILEKNAGKEFPKITLFDAIAHIHFNQYTAPMGAEYLDGEHIADKDGRTRWVNNYWVPKQIIVDEFRMRIGDKWKPMASHLLHSTGIVFSGRYIVARGGICPSGVRLCEVVDIEKMEEFKQKFRS